MHPSRQIAPLGLAQLEAWREYGARWYFRLELRPTGPDHRVPDAEQYHAVCPVCDTSICVVMSEGIGYLMNTEQFLDAITRHLRNVHRDLEGEIYARYKQNESTRIDPRGGGSANGSSPNPSGLQTEKRSSDAVSQNGGINT